jgi:predicted phosphodiesterase
VRRTLLALTCVVVSLAGAWLGVRLASPGEYETSLGRATVLATPSFHGEIDAYIPLADWGVRARAFSAPLKIHIEPRTVDREVVLRAASGDRTLLSQTQHDLRNAVRRSALRAVRFAVGGAVLLAAVVSLALFAGGERRRWVLGCLPAAVLVITVAICGLTLARASATFNEDALERPTFYARGAELVQLLDAAEHARRAGDDYKSKVQGAVQGFASLLSDPTAGQVLGDRKALLVSDLHNNSFALDSLGDYARAKPVFFVGDFGNTGNATEIQALVPPIARLGSRVIAVSGNHDSSAMMLALARRGVTVLTRQGVLRADGRHGAQSVDVDGLDVAGFDDPLEWHGSQPDDPRRIFSFAELRDGNAAATRAQQAVVAWFDGLRRRPDVVLIHENGIAQYLATALAKRGDDRPLTILTGHDHIQHVDRHGAVVVVDAGTVGAAGIYGVGTTSVGLADLHFSNRDDALAAADMIEVEPVSGAAQANRVVNTPCKTAGGDCELLMPTTDRSRPG